MRRIFVTGLIALTLGAAALVAEATRPAAAAGPQSTAAQIKALQRKTAALQKRVTKLEKQVKVVDQTAVVGAAVAFCAVAITADALQSTWTTINSFAQGLGKPAPFPSTTANPDDKNLCQALRVTRLKTAPPTAAPFVALLALLNP